MTKKLDSLSFSNALVRLEEIVKRLEDPDLDLEQGLKFIEEGLELHKYCKQKLIKAQAKIEVLLKDDHNKAGS